MVNMAGACGNISFAEYARCLSLEISGLDGEDKPHFQSIADRLIFCSQESINYSDAIKVSSLTALFLDKIQQYPQEDDIDQLCKPLQPLINLPFLFLPGDILAGIFMHLTVPDLLKIRLSNKTLKGIIDGNSSLQTLIAHFAMEQNGVRYNITSEELKYYLINNKLSVEIKNSLCMLKMNENMSRVFPWISHLIVNDIRPKELKELLAHLAGSKRISILYLCNCECDQECLTLLHDLTERQNRDPIILYLYNCKLPLEMVSSFQVVQLDENEKNEYTIERFFSTESDKIALNEFETMVTSDDTSTEDVIAYAQSLKPWVQLPIISSVWYSAVMNPEKDAQKAPREIRQQAWDFLKHNPHHAAIIAAIEMYRKCLERTSSR